MIRIRSLVFNCSDGLYFYVQKISKKAGFEYVLKAHILDLYIYFIWAMHQLSCLLIINDSLLFHFIDGVVPIFNKMILIGVEIDIAVPSSMIVQM